MSAADDDACPICGRIECEHTDDERAEQAARAAAGDEPLVLAGDPHQASRRKKAQKQRDAENAADLRKIMSTREGRRFVWRFLSMCGLYESSYARARGDAVAMAFNEGQRNIGLNYFNAVLTHCLADYNVMVNENNGGK